jgi:hypothetical protein
MAGGLNPGNLEECLGVGFGPIVKKFVGSHDGLSAGVGYLKVL